MKIRLRCSVLGAAPVPGTSLTSVLQTPYCYPIRVESGGKVSRTTPIAIRQTPQPDAYAIAHNAAPQRRHELEERKGATPADTGNLDVPYAHSLSLVRSTGRHSSFNMEWRKRERWRLAKVSKTARGSSANTR